MSDEENFRRPKSRCYENNSAFYDNRGIRSSRYTIAYEEPIQKPVQWSVRQSKFSYQPRIDLSKWFLDTRPTLEHAVFVRLQDINVTVSMNLPRKARKKHRQDQPLYPKSATSISIPDWNLFSVRPSMHFGLDTEKNDASLTRKRPRQGVLNKALDWYQKEEGRPKSHKKTGKKKVSGRTLEDDIKILESMSITDLSDIDTDDGEKKGRVQFRINRTHSLYETLIDLGRVADEPRSKENRSSAKENAGNKTGKSKAERKNSYDRGAREAPKSVLKTRKDNTNTSMNSSLGSVSRSATRSVHSVSNDKSSSDLSTGSRMKSPLGSQLFWGRNEHTTATTTTRDSIFAFDSRNSKASKSTTPPNTRVSSISSVCSRDSGRRLINYVDSPPSKDVDTRKQESVGAGQSSQGSSLSKRSRAPTNYSSTTSIGPVQPRDRKDSKNEESAPVEPLHPRDKIGSTDDTSNEFIGNDVHPRDKLGPMDNKSTALLDSIHSPQKDRSLNGTDTSTAKTSSSGATPPLKEKGSKVNLEPYLMNSVNQKEPTHRADSESEVSAARPEDTQGSTDTKDHPRTNSVSPTPSESYTSRANGKSSPTESSHKKVDKQEIKNAGSFEKSQTVSPTAGSSRSPSKTGPTLNSSLVHPNQTRERTTPSNTSSFGSFHSIKSSEHVIPAKTIKPKQSTGSVKYFYTPRHSIDHKDNPVSQSATSFLAVRNTTADGSDSSFHSLTDIKPATFERLKRKRQHPAEDTNQNADTEDEAQPEFLSQYSGSEVKFSKYSSHSYDENELLLKLKDQVELANDEIFKLLDENAELQKTLMTTRTELSEKYKKQTQINSDKAQEKAQRCTDRNDFTPFQILVCFLAVLLGIIMSKMCPFFIQTA